MKITHKQYVIVPKGMSAGKMASQVAHATTHAILNQLKNKTSIVDDWIANGECVIVLEATGNLRDIQDGLKKHGIESYVYIDEGLTEVPPYTPTALATEVVTEDKFEFFEMFRLYKEGIGNKYRNKTLYLGFNNMDKVIITTNKEILCTDYVLEAQDTRMYEFKSGFNLYFKKVTRSKFLGFIFKKTETKDMTFKDFEFRK